MKKHLFILVILLLMAGPQAQATKEGSFDRFKETQARGWTQVATVGWEIPKAFVEEKEKHPKAWLFTAIPRGVTNFTFRLVSGVADVALYPFVAGFAEDTTPWTEHMGLPDYAWESADEF